MDIHELTQIMHEFVRSKGWYEANSPRPQTPRNLATSLTIEAAEVLELFQWQDIQTNKQALAAELADVALYLLQIASICEINLEEAIFNKLRSNYERNWEGINLPKE
jgi:NTP pyrophosphatase (non-canonical NTP hydrolase)